MTQRPSLAEYPTLPCSFLENTVNGVGELPMVAQGTGDAGIIFQNLEEGTLFSPQQSNIYA